MKTQNEAPLVRVYPGTRKRLKILAAKHDMTMIDFIEWLLAKHEKSEEEPVVEKS